MFAIGLVQLKYLDEDNERRRQIAKAYDEEFRDNDRVKIVSAPYADECSYHIYELIVPDRENLLNKLSEEGINCGVHYRDNTEYTMYQYAKGTCPKAHEVSQKIITMPVHMWLTDEDVEVVIEMVKKYA